MLFADWTAQSFAHIKVRLRLSVFMRTEGIPAGIDLVLDPDPGLGLAPDLEAVILLRTVEDRLLHVTPHHRATPHLAVVHLPGDTHLLSTALLHVIIDRIIFQMIWRVFLNNLIFTPQIQNLYFCFIKHIP